MEGEWEPRLPYILQTRHISMDRLELTSLPYFPNPPYFYRPSGTEQISVLFRLGLCTVYAATKIRKKKPTGM